MTKTNKSLVRLGAIYCNKISAFAGMTVVLKKAYNLNMQYYVYIMASKKDGVLYIGVTHDLIRRAYEHKESLVEGFTKKYFTKKLVYFETTSDIKSAITREKQIKRWKREWKIELIEKENSDWEDLYYTII